VRQFQLNNQLLASFFVLTLMLEVNISCFLISLMGLLINTNLTLYIISNILALLLDNKFTWHGYLLCLVLHHDNSHQFHCWSTATTKPSYYYTVVFTTAGHLNKHPTAHIKNIHTSELNQSAVRICALFCSVLTVKSTGRIRSNVQTEEPFLSTLLASYTRTGEQQAPTNNV
jgi:hypothetical protein